MSLIPSLLTLLILSPTVLLLVAMADLIYFKKRNLWLAKFALFLFLILSLPWVEEKLAWYWECFPALHEADVQNFRPQAIVVLGGGLERNAREYGDGPTVKPNTLLRLRYAAKLARQSGLPVLASGGHTLEHAAESEAEVMGRILQTEFSIPVVWQETASLTTLENARFSRRILQQQGIDRIMLVTQAYHMPRAEKEFRKAGFQVLAGPTDFKGSASPLENLLLNPVLWLPSVKALNTCFLLIHETVGMLWYSLKN
ncbi:MAG: YdcF family protein [Methylococcales bacterium]|nr:YdcF family protein [Methylococcales bacterium]